MFWSDEHKQSTYRHIMNNSDLEQIMTFRRNKEWVSSRGDASWNLVGHVDANISILRAHSVQESLLIPGFLPTRGAATFS